MPSDAPSPEPRGNIAGQVLALSPEKRRRLELRLDRQIPLANVSQRAAPFLV